MLKESIAKRLKEEIGPGNPDELKDNLQRSLKVLLIPYAEEIVKDLSQIDSVEGIEDELADIKRELSFMISDLLSIRNQIKLMK